MTLQRIRLELARTKEFPNGSADYGYELVAPLDATGMLDPKGWKALHKACTVRRSWGNAPDEHGALVHRRDGRWVFSYEPGDEDDEPVFRLDRHHFVVGEYVSVTEHDGVTRPFRITSVEKSGPAPRMSRPSTRIRQSPAMIEHEEPIQDIAHLGRIELLTPRPKESLWYFQDLLGMEVVHRCRRAVFLRGFGDHAASTLKLTDADRSGVGCVSWRTASRKALARRVKALEDSGRGLGWSNGDFGLGPSYRFRDPDGHLMEVYYEESRYRASDQLRSSLKNLPQKYTGRGVGVRRIDHLALLAADVAANREFVQSELGFRLREQVRLNGSAVELGSWLSPTAVHHQLAYVLDAHGGHGRLHHASFWVDNREDVLRAADILSENGVFIEAGPAKHNNSQGFYLYSYEPGGNRIEVYSGSFLVFAPDWEPVVWNEEERGTGVYWGGALPESFVNYGTPDLAPAKASPCKLIPVIDPR